MKVAEVLGPGWSRCQETYRVVGHVLESRSMECSLHKVEDVKDMVELGVLQRPAVAVDGMAVIFARISRLEEVKQALGLA